MSCPSSSLHMQDSYFSANKRLNSEVFSRMISFCFRSLFILCPYLRPITISAPVTAPHVSPHCIPPPKQADIFLRRLSSISNSSANRPATTCEQSIPCINSSFISSFVIYPSLSQDLYQNLVFILFIIDFATSGCSW